jgi:hypothetical protein
MHAVLMTVTIEPAWLDQAQKTLREEIAPKVSAVPGFVAGYWLEPSGGQGLSPVVFDTEEQARQTALPPGASSSPGVTIANVELRPVTAGAAK